LFVKSSLRLKNYSNVQILSFQILAVSGLWSLLIVTSSSLIEHASSNMQMVALKLHHVRRLCHVAICMRWIDFHASTSVSYSCETFIKAYILKVEKVLKPSKVEFSPLWSRACSRHEPFLNQSHGTALRNSLLRTTIIFSKAVSTIQIRLHLWYTCMKNGGPSNTVLVSVTYGQTYYVLFQWTPYNISALEKLYFEYHLSDKIMKFQTLPCGYVYNFGYEMGHWGRLIK